MQLHVLNVTAPTDAVMALYNEPEHKKAMERRHKSLNWIWAAGDELADAFEPFLDFRKLQETSFKDEV